MLEFPSRTERLIQLHWDHLISRGTYAKNGVVADNLRGVLIDLENWTTPQLVMEVDYRTR